MEYDFPFPSDDGKEPLVCSPLGLSVLAGSDEVDCSCPWDTEILLNSLSILLLSFLSSAVSTFSSKYFLGSLSGPLMLGLAGHGVCVSEEVVSVIRESFKLA